MPTICGRRVSATKKSPARMKAGRIQASSHSSAMLRRRAHHSAAHLSRGDVLRVELDGHVRTMFVLYTLLIVGGVVFFVTVGLTQQ